MASEEAIQRQRERARARSRNWRASMSDAERETYCAKVRELSRLRFKDPEKRAAQTRSKARTARRKIKEGICVSCVDLATCGRYCFKHWLLSVGYKYGLTVRNGGVEALKTMWDAQGGICALTGEKLVPTHNASLDHILPRCRGGSADDVSNLQWVTKAVNFFKSARTNAEIIRMSEKIARHAASTREATNVVPIKANAAEG